MDALIPDVVTVHADGSGGLAFCIYDAKYYTPVLGERAHGVPGAESMTKQILYQSAYRGFVRDCGFSRVANVFLVPWHGGETRRMGRVAFPGVFDSLGGPFTNDVEIWELPAEVVFECHLRGELIDGDALRRWHEARMRLRWRVRWCRMQRCRPRWRALTRRPR